MKSLTIGGTDTTPSGPLKVWFWTSIVLLCRSMGNEGRALLWFPVADVIRSHEIVWSVYV